MECSVYTALCHICKLQKLFDLGASGCVMVCKLDEQNFKNEFESHGVLCIYGLVSHLNKKLSKLQKLISYITFLWELRRGRNTLNSYYLPPTLYPSYTIAYISHNIAQLLFRLSVHIFRCNNTDAYRCKRVTLSVYTYSRSIYVCKCVWVWAYLCEFVCIYVFTQPLHYWQYWLLVNFYAK